MTPHCWIDQARSCRMGGIAGSFSATPHSSRLPWPGPIHGSCKSNRSPQWEGAPDTTPIGKLGRLEGIMLERLAPEAIQLHRYVDRARAHVWRTDDCEGRDVDLTAVRGSRTIPDALWLGKAKHDLRQHAPQKTLADQKAFLPPSGRTVPLCQGSGRNQTDSHAEPRFLPTSRRPGMAGWVCLHRHPHPWCVLWHRFCPHTIGRFGPGGPECPGPGRIHPMPIQVQVMMEACHCRCEAKPPVARVCSASRQWGLAVWCSGMTSCEIFGHLCTVCRGVCRRNSPNDACKIVIMHNSLFIRATIPDCVSSRKVES